MEVWKEIEGFDKGYKVSNLGNVFSEKTNKILKSANVGYGYKQVSLMKDKERRKQYVHRLVAKAFIENPEEYPCINHKDCDKANNRVDNLEWCTHLYNCQSINRPGNVGCVCKHKNGWVFRITINGKLTQQKYFKKKEEADSFRLRYIASL